MYNSKILWPSKKNPQTSRNIGAFNGLYGATKIVNFSTTEQINNEPKKSIHVCKECFHEIGKVKNHSCGTPAKACKNILQLVHKIPDQQQEQVASSILKQEVDIQRESNFESTKQLNNEILLSALGSEMRISVNPKKKKTSSSRPKN